MDQKDFYYNYEIIYKFMKNIFIHPGFTKAGTTTLQNYFFEKNPKIFSLGKPYNSKNTQIKRQLSLEIQKNICFYNEKKVLNLIKKILPKKHKGPIILSDETISSSIVRNQIIANRLKFFFPNSKILFTIRNQITSIQSYYPNRGRILKNAPNPYNGKHVNFKDWFENSLKNFEDSFLCTINYEPLINLFSDLFGKSNIKILLFEEFANNLNLFCNQLGNFIHIETGIIYKQLQNKKANKRDSKNKILYKRFREKFLPNFHPTEYMGYGSTIRKKFNFLINKGEKYDVKLSDKHKNTIIAIYKESNKKLSRKFNLDLKKWDYPI